MEMGQCVIPGMRLCAAYEGRYRAGRGCYELNDKIYASLVGNVVIYGKDKAENDEDVVAAAASSFTIHVDRPDPLVVAKVGDVVTARVCIVNQRLCKLQIVSANEHDLTEPYRAVLRKEDVRMTDKDGVDMYNSFRSNDIILARVISLGEISSGYLVSTAENELGVVSAQCKSSGATMVPISWTQMQCPQTGDKEGRKVAKVQVIAAHKILNDLDDNKSI